MVSFEIIESVKQKGKRMNKSGGGGMSKGFTRHHQVDQYTHYESPRGEREGNEQMHIKRDQIHGNQRWRGGEGKLDTTDFHL